MRLWNLDSGSAKVLEGHTDGVSGALLLPDGQRALSWAQDKTLRLWDLDSGSAKPPRGTHGRGQRHTAAAGRTARALMVTRQYLAPLGPGSGTARLLEGHTDLVSVVRCCCRPDDVPSHGQTTTPCGSGTLPGQRSLKHYVGDQPITSVAFSSKCQLLMAGDSRGRVIFFDLPD